MSWRDFFKPHPAVERLKPFNTDGCSLFWDGTRKHKKAWRHCCVAHDYAYWKGGTRQERIDADHALRACMHRAGFRTLGSLMHIAVRIGGHPYWPTPYRWGYGWHYPRGYRSLSAQEYALIEAQEKNRTFMREGDPQEQ